MYFSRFYPCQIFECLCAENYYFLEGSKGPLVCGNSSDAGYWCHFFTFLTPRRGLHSFRIHDFSLESAPKALLAWRPAGTQITATPALTRSAGPSWRFSDSWLRTTGKISSRWLEFRKRFFSFWPDVERLLICRSFSFVPNADPAGGGQNVHALLRGGDLPGLLLPH